MEGGLGEGRPYRPSFKLSQSSPNIQIALRTSSSISVSLVKTSRLLAHTDGELCTRHLIAMKDVINTVSDVNHVRSHARPRLCSVVKYFVGLFRFHSLHFRTEHV